MKILIPDDYGNRVRDLDCVKRFPQYELDIVPGPIGRDGLARHLADADALVLIRERTYIDAAMLDLAPRLKVISQLGKVRRNLSIAECTQRGIAVAEGPTVSNGTAELTWALIMSSRRFIPQELAAMREGRWQTTMGYMLRGQTLGIWGYGRVGRILAGYGRAFGMRILVWGREQSLLGAKENGYEAASSRGQLFEQSDIVSIHVRLTPQTEGIVAESDLRSMKPTALFVNTGRSELIQPDALVNALRAGRPGYAAADVFETEPVVRGSTPLLEMENFIGSPHMGYVNWQEYETLFGEALDNIRLFFEGEPQNIANPEVLAGRGRRQNL